MIEYCSLASGSCGNSHYIKTEDWNILVDVGMTAKYIKEALHQIGESMSQIDAVFITHEHSDHIRGLAVLARQFDFTIFIDQKIYDYLAPSLAHVPIERFCFIKEGRLDLNNLTVNIFSVSHDATHTYGFTFEQADKKIGITTDIGYISDLARHHLADCDFLVLESNHDEHLVEVGRYPYILKKRILGDAGHLSNRSAGEFIAQIYLANRRLKYCVLAHLSQENNYPELAYMSVQNILSNHSIEIGKDLMIAVAQRRQISDRFRIV